MAKSHFFRSTWRTVLLAALLPGAVSWSPLSALAEDYVAVTPLRLSLLEGSASFWPAGASDWEAAELNLPLSSGDFLASGEASRIELEIGPRAFLRAASRTEFGVEVLERDLLRVLVNAGRLTLDARDLEPGARVELRTAHATLSVTTPGLYDLRVDAERSRFTAYAGSGATLVSPTGSVVLVSGSEVVTGEGFAQPARYEAPASDDWLHWNRERSERLVAAASRVYVPEGIYGVRDLDDHGTWIREPTYGNVWAPAHVPATWAPYTTGRWLWSGAYGWTWVDAQPWGWAPFHYGRWVQLHSGWVWAPGPVAVRPVYAPALVAFLAPPVGIVVSSGPLVSWVALGWGEPVLPWWGPTWYRGRPCWRGWGGPTYINEVHVHVDRRPRHGHRYKIDRYRNQRYPDAVVAVHRRDFDRRADDRTRFRPTATDRFRPGRGDLPAPSRRGARSGDPRDMRPSRPAPEQRMARGPASPERGRGEERMRGERGERTERSERGERTERSERGGPESSRSLRPQGPGGMGGNPEQRRGRDERAGSGDVRRQRETRERVGDTARDPRQPPVMSVAPRDPRRDGMSPPTRRAPEMALNRGERRQEPDAQRAQPREWTREREARPPRQENRATAPQQPRANAGAPRGAGNPQPRWEQPRPSQEMQRQAPREAPRERPREMQRQAPREMQRAAPREMQRQAPHQMRQAAPREMQMQAPRQMHQAAPREMRQAPREMQRSAPMARSQSEPRYDRSQRSAAPRQEMRPRGGDGSRQMRPPASRGEARRER